MEAHLFCIGLFALTSLVFELWGKNGVNLALPAVLHGEILLFARWRQSSLFRSIVSIAGVFWSMGCGVNEIWLGFSSTFHCPASMLVHVASGGQQRH